MCVDYLDKHLVNEDTGSMLSEPCDIPMFEVRESNVPSPEVVSDPPQLCECDVCIIIMNLLTLYLMGGGIECLPLANIAPVHQGVTFLITFFDENSYLYIYY